MMVLYVALHAISILQVIFDMLKAKSQIEMLKKNSLWNV